MARNVKPGDLVIGSFFASGNTCEICQAGHQSRCAHLEPIGALVATSGQPGADLIPGLLAASDVLGTGWFGAERIKEMTGGYGAHSVIEAVGTQESVMQAIRSARHGGPAPVRRVLPDLIRLIEDQAIDPGKVFDLTLPLDQAADGYRAMDGRRAIKTLLRP